MLSANKMLLKTLIKINNHSLFNYLKYSNRNCYRTASTNSNNTLAFEKTLTYWILQYFKTTPKYETAFRDDVFYEQEEVVNKELKDRNYLTNVKTDELLKKMVIISKNRLVDVDTIKNVDDELHSRMNYNDIDCTCSSVLRITDTLLYFTHNRRDLIKSYKVCIKYIKDILAKEEISLQHFIQCTFYTSALKDDPLARDTMKLILVKIHRRTAILDAISPIELSIFCHSLYKTGTKIKSKKILQSIVEAIDKDADILFAYDDLCSSVLKPLHQAKYHDYRFLKELSVKIKNEMDLENHSVISCIYIFKLFSNSLYNDEETINYLADLILMKLNDMHKNKQYIRIKDISTLLKSFCELGNDSLKPKTITYILPILYKTKNKNNKQLRSFAEILLWISILDASILDKSFLNRVLHSSLVNLSQKDVKGVARMNLLLSILSIEEKLYPDKEIELERLMIRTEPHSLEQMFSSQPKLHTIFEAVKCLQNTNKNIKECSFNCQVPYLFMPGITIITESGKKIAVESLDNKVCLHNTLIPHGYMKLKLRLLKKLGYEIITIPQNIVEEGSESLFVTVEDSIRQIEDKR